MISLLLKSFFIILALSCKRKGDWKNLILMEVCNQTGNHLKYDNVGYITQAKAHECTHFSLMSKIAI